MAVAHIIDGQEVSPAELSSVQVLGHELVGHSIGNGMAHIQAGDAAVLQPTQPPGHIRLARK